MVIARNRRIKTLTELNKGQEGVVTRLRGGRYLKQRLEALGIRPGSVVSIVSSMFMRGPITVRVGNARVAIGHGMAQRIEVEVMNDEDTFNG